MRGGKDGNTVGNSNLTEVMKEPRDPALVDPNDQGAEPVAIEEQSLRSRQQHLIASILREYGGVEGERTAEEFDIDGNVGRDIVDFLRDIIKEMPADFDPTPLSMEEWEDMKSKILDKSFRLDGEEGGRRRRRGRTRKMRRRVRRTRRHSRR
jgi:hypothetical protein